MSDLISRQAAIDALDFHIVHMTAYRNGASEGNPLAQYNKGLEDGIEALKQLPSAQPEERMTMSDDLISKKETLAMITAIVPFGEGGAITKALCQAVVATAPSVKLEEKTTKVTQIEHIHGYPDEGNCGNCGEDVNGLYDYCPYCGIKLDWSE